MCVLTYPGLHDDHTRIISLHVDRNFTEPNARDRRATYREATLGRSFVAVQDGVVVGHRFVLIFGEEWKLVPFPARD